MRKEYIIERQGKQFVLYEGLLDEAHEQGLCRISTTLIQIPHPDNGNMAIVAAEVETAKGTFSGIGDASPTNVGKPIVPHIVRMAETRAKARAMRDAVNIGVTALEELGDIDGETQTPHSERSNGHDPQRDAPAGAGVGTAPPESSTRTKPQTPFTQTTGGTGNSMARIASGQMTAIQRLAPQAGDAVPGNLAERSYAEAAAYITSLQERIAARKAGVS